MTLGEDWCRELMLSAQQRRNTHIGIVIWVKFADELGAVLLPVRRNWLRSDILLHV
jgi:hypothetical protein